MSILDRFLGKLVGRTTDGAPLSRRTGLSGVVNPLSRDPLRTLTPAQLRSFRQALPLGEYRDALWALHMAIRGVDILTDKVNYWTSALSRMDYRIDIPEGDQARRADMKLAEAQRALLLDWYERQNVGQLVAHLATARFYGFAMMLRSEESDSLALSDQWTVLRRGLYGPYVANPDLYWTNPMTVSADQDIPPEAMVCYEVQYPLTIPMLRAAMDVEFLDDKWNVALESSSKNQCIIIAGDLISDPDTFFASATNIAAGGSGWLEGGGNGGGNTTTIHHPPAARGLPHFPDRLRSIEERLTKALTGSILTMLTESGSGTLAGGAHGRTADNFIAAEAAGISAALQQQQDRWLLQQAGLLEDGGRPLAWFTLVDRDSVADDDPEAAVADKD